MSLEDTKVKHSMMKNLIFEDRNGIKFKIISISYFEKINKLCLVYFPISDLMNTQIMLLDDFEEKINGDRVFKMVDSSCCGGSVG